MSLREANRSREKNGSWVAIATRDRDILPPEARERMDLSFYLFIHFLLNYIFYCDKLSRRATILDGRYREEERETERRGEKGVYLHAHSDRSSLQELKHQAK